MLPQEVIRKKRNGLPLTAGEIDEFIEGMRMGRVSEAHVAALTMAIFFADKAGTMSWDERVALTRAMVRSGTVLDWGGLNGPVLDKHSTGGVGDKVSLVLCPVIASCGGFVPMISGRGLGHTGGTLDKCDSILGYKTQPDLDLFRRVVREAGCAIIGQTPDLAPADKRVYAVRDVAATEESVSLITASILSKKLAAGAGALVMDVMVGSGALMGSLEDATELAASLERVASDAGLPNTTLITDMNEVLGRSAGNALEVLEAVQMLRGEPGDPRLRELVLTLGSELLVLGGLYRDIAVARGACEASLADGRAAERFARMVTGLGGPADFMDRPERYLKAARITHPVPAPEEGFVTGIDVRALGISIVELGGGRRRTADVIDHSVGFTEVAAIGEAVGGPEGRPLALVHASTEFAAQQAIRRVQAAITISPMPGVRGPLNVRRLGREENRVTP
jgi:thymidine phosphorylase